MTERKKPAPASGSTRRTRVPSGLLLNIVIVLLAVVVAYLGYSFVVRTWVSPPVDNVRDGDPDGKPIVLDVLNGSGEPKVASGVAAYLRARGYDVVEIRNYRRDDLKETIIVDRTGRSSNAEKVAQAVGVPSTRIVQQRNPDYYVDVTIVVGRDYRSLKPSQ